MSVIHALPISQVLVKFKPVKAQMVINCKALYKRVIIINIVIYYVFYIVCINLL